MIRTIVFGAGRMATRVLELAAADHEFEVVALVARTLPDASQLDSGLEVFQSLDEVADSVEADLLIDFTLPGGTEDAARWCKSNRVALLSGVTGIDDETHASLDAAAQAVPVLWAANLSFGINLMAGLLNHLGQVVDDKVPITIEETHHEGKKDAPSGTALFLARHLRQPAGSGSDPEQTGVDFPGIRFESRREGAVIGDHTVRIELEDETLTLAHHASDRRLFARGALDAGRWLVGKSPGRYSAGDWIRARIEQERASNGQPGVA